MNFFKMVLAVLVAQVLIGFALFFGLGLMTALFSSGDTVQVSDGIGTASKVRAPP